MCNSWFVFIDQKDINVHYNKLSQFRGFTRLFPDLKGPRAPSQNCKKKPLQLSKKSLRINSFYPNGISHSYQLDQLISS